MAWSRQAQLLAAGLDRDAIAYRRRVGRLHLLHRGVYAVGHRPPSPLATAIAAVLACGPDAALSHGSAAALWRIIPRWPSPTHVTAPTKHRAARHPRPPLPARRHHHPLRHPRDHPASDPRRPRRRPDPQANSPEPSTKPKSNASSPADQLTTLPTRYPGRRTAALTPQKGATRSHLEDRFVRFLKRHHLPLPELNQRIAGHEVDAVYRQHKLVIELDSRQFHTTPTAFEQDRDRDADLLNAGFSTLRITDHRLKHQQAKEAQRLKDILRSRS